MWNYTGGGLRSRKALTAKRCLTAKTSLSSSTRLSPISSKGLIVISLDEIFYESLWNSRPHYCEECGCFLGDDFRDDNGRVVDRFRYSHILGKKAYPAFRHTDINMNLLCLRDHNKWASPDKVNMKIYKDNINRISIMLGNGIQE